MILSEDNTMANGARSPVLLLLPSPARLTAWLPLLSCLRPAVLVPRASSARTAVGEEPRQNRSLRCHSDLAWPLITWRGQAERESEDGQPAA